MGSRCCAVCLWQDERRSFVSTLIGCLWFGFPQGMYTTAHKYTRIMTTELRQLQHRETEALWQCLPNNYCASWLLLQETVVLAWSF